MAPLDEVYLIWLYGQVANIKTRSPSRTYWNLFLALFKTEFVWFVPNDDARAADGRELRIQFILDEEILEVDPDWMEEGCSFLEMLIALSRRAAYMTDDNAPRWFWHLIDNMGLTECTDTFNEECLPEIVREVTDQIIFRSYAQDGRGGLFPLKRPQMDQTKTELWYQLNAYVLERGRR